ncbi:MAG: BrnT family toxin [Acidobacteriota bacterium]|nr:BrnT family toxin [Acidobacteriota bacterium]MDQ3420023.1 BrnT family toxin [Acidobacteriota bacterium]
MRVTPTKASENAAKLGGAFTEAITAFGDPLELVIPDPDHSVGERRLLSIGMSSSGRLLVLSYTERGARIRLISARTATAQERKTYGS